MPHTRAATLHLRPQVNDTLVSNFREPILTLIEDTSGIHDTLIAACDPARYKGLGVENWEVSDAFARCPFTYLTRCRSTAPARRTSSSPWKS